MIAHDHKLPDTPVRSYIKPNCWNQYQSLDKILLDKVNIGYVKYEPFPDSLRKLLSKLVEILDDILMVN